MQRQFPYRRKGGEPADELEHFEQCPDCGTWLDCRNLGEVIDHERHVSWADGSNPSDASYD